jgi:hypothetical protein
MATINITVQSLLNAAQFDPYTVSDGITVATLKADIDAATGIDSTWYNLSFNSQVLSDGSTLSSYSIINNSIIGIGNVIGRLPTLEDRQLAKLQLSHLERVELANTRPDFDIAELPSYYDGNTSVPNPHPDGLIEGRPWIA